MARADGAWRTNLPKDCARWERLTTSPLFLDLEALAIPQFVLAPWTALSLPLTSGSSVPSSLFAPSTWNTHPLPGFPGNSSSFLGLNLNITPPGRLWLWTSPSVLRYHLPGQDGFLDHPNWKPQCLSHTLLCVVGREQVHVDYLWNRWKEVFGAYVSLCPEKWLKNLRIVNLEKRRFRRSLSFRR